MTTCWYDLIALLILIVTVISCYLYLKANKTKRYEHNQTMNKFFSKGSKKE
ncbi:MAG: hypothetical protein PHH04_07005 [Thomasclavelia sp.]|nr:hypothetical protein [Thomasclavelia sp.]